MLRFQPRNLKRLRTLQQLAAALILTAAPSAVLTTAQAAQNGKDAPESSPAPSYDWSIEGAPDGLQGKLELISELAKKNRNYPTSAALRRAARRDVDAFNDALQAAGYYAGSTDFELIPGESGQLPRVVFTIDPGELFCITGYNILYRDEAEGRPQTLEEAEIKTEGAADGATLKEKQEAFLAYLWNNGYPDAAIVTRRVLAELDKGEAEAVFVFESGPRAKFGKPVIEGGEHIDPSFISRMKTWEEGEEFERAKMTAYADRIRETGIFSSVQVSAGKTDEDGVAPIIVEVRERKRRTIGAGVSYSTAEGPGGRLFFEHRNIFGNGENARFEVKGSQVEQSATLSLTRPWPKIDGEAFANAAFSNETTDAFDARTIELSGGVSKKWLNDNLETRGALAFETSRIRNTSVDLRTNQDERNYFVSTPLTVIWDSEDELLNPQKGFRASFNVTPYMGSDYFTQSELSARSRVHFGENDVVTLAARMAMGATFGSSFSELPLNKRYYAGGGGSVRGYGFQEAGPLDADGDPLGGRSKIEGAFEARVKVINNLQIAGFIDAGSVSTKSIPDFTDDYFIGAGGGVRYFTPIGPIRVDVAVPLEKRETDRGFQIYIALGQPF
ncbi:autotransporter assembly complex protein TamA [Hyphococcus sp.]|uniref:autotransporter assembly complex protein TamA n=1 Tax=Hyphococcus sp. TaxID=2038636 RepID=UPI003D0F1F48